MDLASKRCWFSISSFSRYYQESSDMKNLVKQIAEWLSVHLKYIKLATRAVSFAGLPQSSVSVPELANETRFQAKVILVHCPT